MGRKKTGERLGGRRLQDDALMEEEGLGYLNTLVSVVLPQISRDMAPF